eukprot:Gregarina_sp_Pseudo_9__5766@NODE_854_length_2130_cov_16_825442_g802_i0_p1_GENE_NODE_854_length_2130_cov_16_825442_g802_i0NODE_854_length_2130_cov_16_825442_g802_i0_p1_ORF_typecomplete_len669_score27_63RT_RNaseH/PF17917_1/2_8e27RT_RNaseH_2/PF17919_1/2_1e26Integrase_H2C2/PF17921_1/1_5e14rve/PF00665_26/1_3e04rve/PF00665_26/3_4e14zfH2C2/PF09337_10/0_072zfH2C2/PF09337_10/5_1e03Ribosomal_S4Pg/PF11993_8/0_15DDE_2/PF02914_15/0_35DDE_2/PF02914_15/4_5e03_NODE_854_length_2130_cov_16_825442_g802_i0102016
MPKTKKGLRSFLGAASYMRSFIPNYVELTDPLTAMTAKRNKFSVDEKVLSSFHKIKEALGEAVLRHPPDNQKPFIIYTDASDVGIGAALAQESEEGEHIIHLGSKRLNDTERRWATTEREAYAVLWALEYFDRYTRGSGIILKTDHQALVYLKNASTPKLTRWAIRIASYAPEITYVKGVDNGIADWLSRLYEDELANWEDISIPIFFAEIENAVSIPQLSDLAREYEKEEQVPGVVMKNGVPMGGIPLRPYIPRVYRDFFKYILHGSYLSGHVGVTKVKRLARRTVWWPNMNQDLEEWCAKCVACAMMRAPKITQGVKGSLTNVGVSDLISLDYIGPRHWNGSKYHVLSVIDHATRFLITSTTKNATARHVISVLIEQWIPLMGVPKRILADRGLQFDCKEFEDFVTRSLGAEMVYAAVAYPQGNGVNESSHRIIDHAIKMWTPDSALTFSEIVGWATFIHNSLPNEIVKESPINLLTGRDAGWPGLQAYTMGPSNQDREKLMQQRLQFEQFLQYLNQQAMTVENETCEIGDWVLYNLTEGEQQKIRHKAQHAAYRPHFSLPHRVVQVRAKSAMLAPIFTRGPRIWKPCTQLKLLRKDLPHQLMSLLPKIIEVKQKQGWESIQPHPWDGGIQRALPSSSNETAATMNIQSGGANPSLPFMSQRRPRA